MHIRLPHTLGVAAILILVGCSKQKSGQSAPPPDAYTPGLGEIMTLTQARHEKLWHAGTAKNWALASYELDELEESFADILKYHPTHKCAPVPLKEVLKPMMDPSVKKLRQAVKAKDHAAFITAYDSLTNACNACHQATNFSFNVVTRPHANSFPNQDFTPAPE